ncbi:MAG: tRNA pseudouridine(38-40) synthase TruA [Lachnospiraceae bacterium]|nr:tRNA pseudouridine(38-40) synthase TruA [Lachnospiraceae bacterium]
MKRIRLTVAYDGTDYAGFQIQKSGVPTIEGELQKAVCALTGECPEIIGASRTDAGVHALCNQAVFDTDSPIPAQKFAAALNTRLPEAIRVQSSCEAAADYHPRKVASVKTYEYRIYNASCPLPVFSRYTHFSDYPYDLGKMRQAAAALVGEHDFRSFCSVYTQARTTVRTITEITVEEQALPFQVPAGEDSWGRRGPDPRMIVIRVSGTGFLYNMVRIIAGTLMDVGRGRTSPEEMAHILAACERRAAGPTAPACGLCLVNYQFASRQPDESGTAAAENMADESDFD